MIIYYLWHRVPGVTTVELSGMFYSLQRCRWLSLINGWIMSVRSECDVPQNIHQITLQLHGAVTGLDKCVSAASL